MRMGLVYGLAIAGAVACQGGSYFVCEEDGDCSADGAAGVCQPAGACSFPDDACASGARYGAQSPPELAGECVELGGSTGETGDIEGSTGGSGDPATSTTDPSLDDSTGPVDPTAGGCPPEWWDCAWAHRQPLTLAKPVAEPLTDVPVLVLLTEGRVDHGLMQADGEDLRFVSASGQSVPFEIEHWDPEGVSTIWVHTDELGGAADRLWMYYGNPIAEGADVPAGVWSEPFEGVWHLEAEPLDSTPNASDATTNGTIATEGGQIGNGLRLASSNARIDVGATPALGDALVGGGTVSAWIRPRGWGGGGFGRIAHKEGGSEGWLFYVGSGGRLRFAMWLAPGNNTTWTTFADVIALHRWTHVAVTYDPLGPSIPRMFVDGVEQELDAPSEQPMVTEVPSDVDVPLTLGNRPANDRRFDGILDEVRIQTALRSAEWIAVQVASERDDLLDYGPIESWEAG